MIVKILDSVFAEVIKESHLQISPRWMLDSLAVVVASFNSMEEYERQIMETFGSFDSMGSGAEGMRFGQKDLLLKSVWFRVPEVNLPSDKVSLLWQNQEPQIGLLHLLSGQEFHLDPTDVRWFDPNTGILICMTEESLTVAGERLRLRIAEDFDLLFVDQKLCGWLLSSAEKYLVELWETSYSTEADKELKALIYESLDLVSEPNIEKMDNQDPDILQALVDLHSRIKCDYGSVNQRRVLCTWVAEIIERFYDQRL
ncbi:MAG TPA: hypothetical protein DEG17_02080 [Cyanobacteria bacterium UBA11149]|nr:hypothetical protein [Cyanobacteria bacterium UBA11367]HBE56600.1 hypothetical protein [Cyanobacteria bacterium UBA11366]HBK64079.1 hypothetical protein [Cyanobacteria bacterium UBA11166]HBR73825.1 hypothetical protein [Cyanobacteria bacterium UBA11159]HBS70058.1 hypothetical protein [Cyanobacteria bacterium UBA11153]HBW87697.1 hypothetical protein [Cyanobacteria bacterium UBA11149]HCA95368.1 hypothetical protein [Cyanobacteria bacterium UBA9226]